MAERTRGVWAFLSNPRIYWALQRSLGGVRAHRLVLSEHVKPQTGERLLDLGCGPGRTFPLLPEVSYVGVDLSSDYIEAARRRFGDRAEFHCVDVSDASLVPHSFDVAVAFGLTHHLEDDESEELFRAAARALTDEGRMVTVDPTLKDDQNPVAHWLISRDRGTRVRRPEEYAAIAEPFFEDVRTTVREDLLWVPYTQTVLECTRPRRNGANGS